MKPNYLIAYLAIVQIVTLAQVTTDETLVQSSNETERNEINIDSVITSTMDPISETSEIPVIPITELPVTTASETTATTTWDAIENFLVKSSVATTKQPIMSATSEITTSDPSVLRILESSVTVTNNPIPTTTLEETVTKTETVTKELNPCLEKYTKSRNFSAPRRRISEEKCFEYKWIIKDYINAVRSRSERLTLAQVTTDETLVQSSNETERNEINIDSVITSTMDPISETSEIPVITITELPVTTASETTATTTWDAIENFLVKSSVATTKQPIMSATSEITTSDPSVLRILESSVTVTNNPIPTTTLEETVTKTETVTKELNPCLEKYTKSRNFSAPRRRISEEKCFEYKWIIKDYINAVRSRSERCYDYVLKHDLPVPAEAYDEYGDYIYDGDDALNFEFPHMGGLGWKTDRGWMFMCGSTLISDNFFLTAAHCSRVALSRYPTLTDPEPKMVRVGVVDLMQPISDYTISRIIVHPKYNSPQQYYDIALIEVDKKVKFDTSTRPACLWTNSDTSSLGQYAKVTGWGKVKQGKHISTENFFALARYLQKGVVNFIDSQTCEKLLMHHRNRKWGGLCEHQICAGNLTGGVDTCQGDSGGPLQVQIPGYGDKSIYYVVGVTSFGHYCAKKNTPSVYTRVSSFLDWIESIVWPSTKTKVTRKTSCEVPERLRNKKIEKG